MYAAKRTQKYSKDDLVKNEKFLSCHRGNLHFVVYVAETGCTL